MGTRAIINIHDGYGNVVSVYIRWNGHKRGMAYRLYIMRSIFADFKNRLIDEAGEWVANFIFIMKLIALIYDAMEHEDTVSFFDSRGFQWGGYIIVGPRMQYGPTDYTYDLYLSTKRIVVNGSEEYYLDSFIDTYVTEEDKKEIFTIFDLFDKIYFLCRRYKS